MKILVSLFFFIFLNFLIFQNYAGAHQVNYGENGLPYQKIPLDQYLSKKTRHIQIYNRYLRSLEFYKAVPLLDLLKDVMGFYGQENFDVSFVTKTGYAPFIPGKSFKERKAYLAYDRADGQKFVTIGKVSKTIKDLGPLFLIWDNSSKKINRWEHKFSWVYQITGLSLNYDFGNIDPGSGVDPKIQKGFQHYKNHCMGCHAVGTIGGKLAKNLFINRDLKKWSRERLFRMLDKPAKFKIKNMPAFAWGDPNREKKKLELLSYLKYLAKTEVKATKKNRRKSSDIKQLLDQFK
ncbi:MAG: cytochrome c [Halobacteriovoraceae bacterium]|nr:cytochrome c [Halobacteriovoraceae bacterium]